MAITTTTMRHLEVTRLPHGGFVVSEAAHYQGMMNTFLFAASTIEEALRFMKTVLTQTETKTNDRRSPR